MKKTKDTVRTEVDALIHTQWKRIVEAYMRSEGELALSIKVKMTGNMSVCEITTELSYYPEPKIKVKSEPVTADEKQMPLPSTVDM